MGCDIAEIRPALAVLRHAVAVVADSQEVPAVIAPTRDGDAARPRIDAVLDQLRNGLQGTRLRQRDDGDRVPVVADPQAAAGAAFAHGPAHAGLFVLFASQPYR